jgi:hypothetical protein
MFLLMPDRICICAGAFDRRSEKQASCTLQRKISREGKEPAKEMAKETQQKRSRVSRHGGFFAARCHVPLGDYESASRPALSKRDLSFSGPETIAAARAYSGQRARFFPFLSAQTN